MHTPLARTLIDIAAFICLLVLPWYVTAALLAGLTIYFPLYLEALFFGFFFDTLYASRYGFPYIGLLVSLAFLVAVLAVRTRIRT
jgi:hypothetical protein